MKATNHNFRPRTSLILLIALAVWAISGTSYAQTLNGSPGAGWQTWSTTNGARPDLGTLGDLNSNGAPYWDVPFLAFGQYNGNLANKSVGWCMTSNGDCQGIGSALFAPGTLPFWSMPYDAAADNPMGTKPGALDPKVYFKSNSYGTASYRATLYLNTATNTFEINEFGWFETDSTGTMHGATHVIFQGTGFSHTGTPDPVGKTVTFTPTQYFGYYYNDVSDPQGPNFSSGCSAYTIFAFNDSDCTAASGQGDHVFAIFVQPSSDPTYWIAGQDPSMCSDDGDCNLTIVKVTPVVTRD